MMSMDRNETETMENVEKNETGVRCALCDRMMNAEGGGDFILPDYLPEIRRLLYVEQSRTPPTKYVAPTEVELSGAQDFQVWYVGADGRLYTAPLSADYHVSAPLERQGDVALDAGVTVCATAQGEGSAVRVSAPRRLNIRSRLRCHVRAFGTVPTEATVMGAVDAGSVFRRAEEVESMTVRCGLSDPLTLREELSGVGDGVRVVGACGAVAFGEVRAVPGAVRGTGELILTVWLEGENGEISRTDRRMPLDVSVETEGVGEGAPCRMSGVVSRLEVTVEEARILCEAEVLAEARCLCPVTVSYTADLFSSQLECELQTLPCESAVARGCGNGRIAVRERIPLSDLTLPEGAVPVGAFATALSDVSEEAGRTGEVTGLARYTLLLCREGEYSVSEIALPLGFDTGSEGEPTDSFDVSFEANECRARIEGDALMLDADWTVVWDRVGKVAVKPVVSAEFGEPCTGADSSAITVCYPLPEDTPWSVAKRYRVDPATLRNKGKYYLI